MKKYMIEVTLKFEKNPTADEFANVSDGVIATVDNYCNNRERSFHVTFPLQKDIDEGRFTYRIHILIESEKELHSAALFELLNFVDKHPPFMVTVRESRFCKQDSPIFWHHKGEMTDWDGDTYISSNYDLYVNGNHYYTIQYVPVAIECMSDRDKQRYDGVTYMWRCAGSHDNFMEAKTIDEAIEEFEQIYSDKLWTSVENLQEELSKASHDFKQFSEYRMNKNEQM